MKRVLVYGLKDPIGGVERVVMDYVKHMVAAYDITFDFIIFAPSFSLEQEVTQLGCRVISVPVRRKDPAGYKKAMAELFEKNRYCAVWGNFSGLTNIDILVLGKKHGVPVRAVHSHASRLYWGSPVLKYVVKLLHSLNKRRFSRYTTHYWACSQMAGEFMYPPALWGKMQVINNAVDTERFFPDEAKRAAVRKQLGLAEDAVVIGHVARMCPVKNQSFLLQIMAQAVKLQPKARLLFVGDGELRQELEAQTQALGLAEHVLFTGNREDVPDLLRAMDVYVLTSFSEGLSVSAVEAQATGLPCVLSSSVSKQTDLTGSVRFVPLEESASVWARALLEQAAQPVEDPTGKLTRAGYNMTEAARRLYCLLTGKAEGGEDHA